MKIKNSSAIPLRAAYLRGPYALYTACYPSTFDPNIKQETPDKHGVPQFEPNLKAGGSWTAELTVPDDIRETAGKANVRRTTDGGIPSFTWIIEISSQVIFSTGATVHYELLVGRDSKSVELGFAVLTGSPHVTPGKIQDHQHGRRREDGYPATRPKGVYSKAVDLVVEDTASLWNKPVFPKRNNSPGGQDRQVRSQSNDRMKEDATDSSDQRKWDKRKKVHLVILTHGLHGNLGVDMLYMKESIDAAARQARLDAKKSKAIHQGQQYSSQSKLKTSSNEQEEMQPKEPGPGDESDDDEEVIVRGFSGNVIRTERGIQYLGKRLAKYILTMTYPDQPFVPTKKSMRKTFTRALTGQGPQDRHEGPPSHHSSSIHNESGDLNPAYQITSISFIGHSLGGLVQTYAIAYIHKHSPQFFDKIKPINFVALATPFLGLSNENPIYVKFALDFGLVGRSGQDLGLTWRAPTVVRSGWGAMIGGIGTEGQRAHKQIDPGSKPLLRILPSGPAHQVLKKFRNRTVYSNVVNDGIVPLRTSCLLFLDWRGLGRVEKARRENGLVGTMAGWGWAELTGANSSSHRVNSQIDTSGDEGTNTPTQNGHGDTVPQPTENATEEDTTGNEEPSPLPNQFLRAQQTKFQDEEHDAKKSKEGSPAQPSNPLTGLLTLLRPNSTDKSHHNSPKQTKIYKRGQTMKSEQNEEQSEALNTPEDSPHSVGRPLASRGDSILDDPTNVFAPPKTTFFESAGDILNPPLPTLEYLIDPTSRPRTIFHDRVYHPEDIPPPPPGRRRNSLMRSLSFEGKKLEASPQSTTVPGSANRSIDQSGMKVEEKIARAYHKDLSWRKVLVRLEPDAHNNMIVRRTFSNAYGWPVISHLVDTHFAYTFAAATADREEPNEERAKPMDEAVNERGGKLKEQSQKQPEQCAPELRESEDRVDKLKSPTDSLHSNSSRRPTLVREDSSQWTDGFFEDNDDDDDDDEDDDFDSTVAFRHAASGDENGSGKGVEASRGMSEAEINDFLHSSPTQG